MHTEARKDLPVVVFLFGHQDDEYGVFEQIVSERELGHRVVCAYLTSGVPRGGSPERRNRESLSILSRIGLAAEDVVFAGAILSIEDGKLAESLDEASDWLVIWLASFSSLRAVYVPAWEGGHPDHDSLHAIAVQTCAEGNAGLVVRQFPLYNGFRCWWLFFRVLSPLRNNGPVERTRISWGRRLRFLRYALGYPSQWKTWIGLFPFVFLHYVLRGWQELQPVDTRRILERPHDGPLYYEKRGFSSWPAVRSRICQWLSKREPQARTKRIEIAGEGRS